MTKSAVIASAAGMLLLQPSFCQGSVQFSGSVADEAGAPVAAITVVIYPVQEMHGRGSAGTLGRADADTVRAVTDSNGAFEVSVSREGDYFVCTTGAPLPLLDRCAFDLMSAIAIRALAEPARLVLAKGQIVTVVVSDALGRLRSDNNTDVTLGIQPVGFAPPRSRSVTSTAVRFVFGVPPGSDGRMVVRTRLNLRDKSGQAVAVGAPSLEWSANDEPIVLTAQ